MDHFKNKRFLEALEGFCVHKKKKSLFFFQVGFDTFVFILEMFDDLSRGCAK